MQETRHHTPRVVIIGAGAVGGAYAAALLGTGLAAEIVLLDRDTARATSVARHLIAAASFAPPARVWVGGVADCAGAALTVLTAGVAPGRPARPADLARETSALVRQMAPQVARHNPRGLLLIATDPVDVLTYTAVTLSGLPARQVIGSGTIVETARFRAFGLCSSALVGAGFLPPADLQSAPVAGLPWEASVRFSACRECRLLADFVEKVGVAASVKS